VIVIFLDVDGVLNTNGELGADAGLHYEKVMLLRAVVRKTKAKLVLSSSWRYMGIGVAGVFSQCLYTVSPVAHQVIMRALIGRTPLENVPRVETIRMWLKSNPSVEHYVALDDDETVRQLGDNYSVITKSGKGLTQKKALELARKLQWWSVG